MFFVINIAGLSFNTLKFSLTLSPFKSSQIAKKIPLSLNSFIILSLLKLLFLAFFINFTNLLIFFL